MASIFGSTPEDYYGGAQWLSTAPQYNQYNAGQLGQNYQNATNQLLSGQLSGAQQAGLNQQFGQNLASVREGGYGMPSGAEKGLEYSAASQNALQAALLGQQNISQGLNAGMSYMNLGSQNNQYANQFGQSQSQFAGGLTQDAYKNAAQDKGIFGSLLGAGVNFGLSALTGGLGNTGGYNATGFSNSPNNYSAMLGSNLNYPSEEQPNRGLSLFGSSGINF